MSPLAVVRALRLRAARAVLACLVLAAPLWPPLPASLHALSQAVSPPAPAAERPEVRYLRRAISFEENRGQTDARVAYLARVSGGTLFLTRDEAVLRLRAPSGEPSVLRMRAGAASRLEATERLPGTVSYFLGRDPAAFRSAIPTYASVRARDAFPGVDAVYHGRQGELEVDFVVAPGADPGGIRLAFSGARGVAIEGGDLVLHLPGGDVRQHAPVVYQDIGGRRREVAGGYVMSAPDEVRFRLAAYDTESPLVIDPVLSYSTYLGGQQIDQGYGIAVDAAGAAYVAGATDSPNFPVSLGAYQASDGGGLSHTIDAFITKMDPTGVAPVYSTYLGGLDAVDEARAIAVDAAGNAYVAGGTDSPTFPIVGGLQAWKGAGSSPTVIATKEAWVAKLDPTGANLLYSTYLGGTGNEEALSVAVDPAGDMLVAGVTDSVDFPTQSPVQPALGGGQFATDGFVAKIAPSGASLVYATYLGGNGSTDTANGVAADAAGNAYVTGQTDSTDFPLKNARQPQPGSGEDAFVTKLGPAGALVYSTYLGGGGVDIGNAIAVDAAGDAFIAGETSSLDFPTQGAAQPQIGGGMCSFGVCSDAFVTKLGSDGKTLAYSTYLGGSGFEHALGVAVDPAGNAHVAGRTQSLDFPAVDAISHTPDGSWFTDAFVARYGPSGGLLAATYLGGENFDEATAVAADSAGNAYVTGTTASMGFPTDAHAFQATNLGANDGFVSKIAYGPASPSGSTVDPPVGGDTGWLTVLIHGQGFAPGATVKLSRAGQPDSPAVYATTLDGGATIGAVLDLYGKAHGAWDVVVQNPGAAPKVLAGAFTVEAGRPPDISVDVLTRHQIRVGREETITLVVTNSGNIDAVGVPVTLDGIPGDATVVPDFPVIDPPPPDGAPPVDWGMAPDSDTSNGTTSWQFVLPRLPPGSGLLPFKIVVTEPTQLDLTASVGSPILQESQDEAEEGGDLGYEVFKCILSAAGAALDVASLVNPELRVVKLAEKYGVKVVLTTLETGVEVKEGHTPGIVKKKMAFGIIDAATEGEQAETLKKGYEIADTVNSVVGAVKECGPLIIKGIEWLIKVLSAIDPNDKAGAVGGGDAHALCTGKPLAYQISFENQASASLPAQEVVVTDPLDPSIDLSTLNLGPITVAGAVLVPPPGSRDYTGYIDLRDTTTLVAKVVAHLDTAARKLTWTFSSIDPSVGGPPSDPLAGFLPPNLDPPQGEGSVIFTAMPASSAGTGTTIENTASIVFDSNAPIATPTWSNTIDHDPPSAAMDPLPATSPASIPVSWSGTDKGSGILGYTVYVDDGSGTSTPWLQDTKATSGTFAGKDGATYTFHVVAQDVAGNVGQPSPSTFTKVSTATKASTPASSSSCGCRVAAPASEGDAAVVVLAAVGLVARRRRRRGGAGARGRCTERDAWTR